MMTITPYMKWTVVVLNFAAGLTNFIIGSEWFNYLIVTICLLVAGAYLWLGELVKREHVTRVWNAVLNWLRT